MLTTRREFMAAVLAAQALASSKPHSPGKADEDVGYLRPWAAFRNWRIDVSLQCDREQGLLFRHIRASVRDYQIGESVLIADLDMPLLRQRGHVMVPSEYSVPPDLHGGHAIDAVVEEAMVSMLLSKPTHMSTEPAMVALACLVTERMLVGPDGQLDNVLAEMRQAFYEKYRGGLRAPPDTKWMRFADDGRLHGSWRDG